MGETSESAVLREVFEETGVHYEIEKLAVIHENFFDENTGTLKGFDCHEISFYYLMKLRGTQELNSNSYSCGAKEEKGIIDYVEQVKSNCKGTERANQERTRI